MHTGSNFGHVFFGGSAEIYGYWMQLFAVHMTVISRLLDGGILVDYKMNSLLLCLIFYG
jgi:hypothetical protein